MKYGSFLLFLVLDFLAVIAIFLLFTYLGMSNLILMVFALIILVLGYYDIASGKLSYLLVLMFDLPDTPGKRKLINYIPLLLAVAIIAYSIPALLEHGLVDSQQRRMMQGETIVTFALYLLVVLVAVTLCAFLFYLWLGRKSK